MVMDPIELSRKIRAAFAPCSLGTWPTPADTRPDLAAAGGRWGRRRGVPGGGGAPIAVVGQLLGGLETGAQLAAPPGAVVLPLGSGGTAAGLSLAMAAVGWPTAVVAVRVAPAVIANRWQV